MMDAQLKLGFEKKDTVRRQEIIAAATSRLVLRSRTRASLRAAVLVAAAATTGFAFAGEVTAKVSAATMLAQSVAAGSPDRGAATNLSQLISEALRNNPEIAAAAHERDAAGHRVSPAGALDDPMVEAGFLNLPIDSLRFDREDMTMKMLGITQKLPYPGKRGLREDVAAKNAESVGFGYRETLNRVVRDTKVAYYDLALVDRSIEAVERNRMLVEQLLRIAEGRYAVGQYR